MAYNHQIIMALVEQERGTSEVCIVDLLVDIVDPDAIIAVDMETEAGTEFFDRSPRGHREGYLLDASHMEHDICRLSVTSIVQIHFLTRHPTKEHPSNTQNSHKTALILASHIT